MNVIGLSAEQEANLRKLAAYLRSGKLRAEFDMEGYDDGYEYDNDRTDCGSVGCAVGHGPYAGIAKEEGEGWNSYCRRVFGCGGRAFDWCFASDWQLVDNTPDGAAARIELMLDKGIPDGFDLRYLHDNDVKLYR